MAAMAATGIIHSGALWCSPATASRRSDAAGSGANAPLQRVFGRRVPVGLVCRHRRSLQRVIHCAAEASEGAAAKELSAPTSTSASKDASSSKAASKDASSAKSSKSASPSEAAPEKKKHTMKKGQIVRVDKEKYLDSVEYLAVDHPKYFRGLDYIYEDRGEVLDLRFFEAGEYALISWAGIPTSAAWLPTYMLIKADKLSYKRV